MLLWSAPRDMGFAHSNGYGLFRVFHLRALLAARVELAFFSMIGARCFQCILRRALRQNLQIRWSALKCDASIAQNNLP